MKHLSTAVVLSMVAACMAPQVHAETDQRWYLTGLLAQDDWSSFPVDAGPVLGALELDEQWSGGLAFGWQSSGPLRVELEAFARSADGESLPALALDNLDGAIDLRTVMVNAVADLHLDGVPVVPYAGVGAGWAMTDLDAVGNDFLALDGDDDGYAWQAMVGVAVPLNDQWRLSLDVRYLETESLNYRLIPAGIPVEGSARIDLLSVAAGVSVRF